MACVSKKRLRDTNEKNYRQKIILMETIGNRLNLLREIASELIFFS